MPDVDYTFKILLLGDPAVGKTSLVQRFLHGKFTKDYITTVGMEPYNRYQEINGSNVLLNLWDIAAGTLFTSIRNLFFKGAKGALIVFDLTRRDTFENVEVWLEEVGKFSPDLKFILVGNKNDLRNDRVVYRREGNQKAREIDSCIGYIETSALTGMRVEDAFLQIAKLLYDENAR